MGHVARNWVGVAAAVVAGVGGCATCPESIRQALKRPALGHSAEAAQAYTIACPDRLRVDSPSRPSIAGEFTVEPDGCITLVSLGRVRVDGATSGDVASLITRLAGTAPGQVNVSVLEHESRRLLIFGPANGAQRIVPYRGPETVTDLLRRTGGLEPGTAYQTIHVVRPHVAAGRRPEVFPVDLAAILVKNDPQTDIRLEPSDQIYLGETRGAGIVRCLPPWLRAMCPGMKSIDTQAEPVNNE